MKTVAEIQKKAREGFDTDPFGFGKTDLIIELPYEEAKEYLKPEVTKEEWEKDRRQITTDDDILKEIAEYVSFAQGKIDDERGISADRSCQHFIAWFWLIDEDFSNELADTYRHDYAPYGQPVLNKVKKYLDEKGIAY